MRVVIADDTMLIREGTARLLEEAGFEIVGKAGDAQKLLRAVALDHPDVAIVDIKMPPTHTDEGLVAAEQIRASHPEVAVLVLSQYLESRYATRLLEHHPEAVGYLLKERVSDIAVLADAIRRIAEGECVLDPTIVARLMQRPRHRGPLDELTDREREVLALIAEGRSNHAIAELLVLSPKTVEAHIGRVFAKLGLDDTPDYHRRVLAVLAFLRS
jgi:DNA-binding NarL/FixJ family response regulator